jgi:hypothetical protein
VSESKISITFKNQISDIILEEIHEKLIKYWYENFFY